MSETTKDLRLIALPYKTVLRADDVTDEDRELATHLYQLAAGNGQCTEDAIANLILMAGANKCGGSDDWRLADLICGAGYDGFIRVVNNTEGSSIAEHIRASGATQTHPYDEVLLCHADSVTRVVREYDYRPQDTKKYVDRVLPGGLGRGGQ